MKSIDFTGQKVVALRDVTSLGADGATELLVCSRTIVTPSARDFLLERGVTVRTTGTANAASGAPCRHAGNDCRDCPGAASRVPAPSRQPAATAPDDSMERLFASPEAEAIKAEIVDVGRKLWQRMYVDGNGGNISYRIAPNAVICTPTLLSKADLRPEDLCLVDLEGNQILGPRARTSEILLHLEIYKNVPDAKAAVHCHPPHATAYAITGRVPPTCVIPEFEVFVGKVALAPYETPGTQRFAETVLPFVKQHNTVLLSNHGIICWADTVTHAEWYAEVLDTYCWTLMLATQIGEPISYISPEKTSDLLALKKRLGLPDARHELLAQAPNKECRLCDLPEMPGGISVRPSACPMAREAPSEEDVDAIVQGVTDAVMAALGGTIRT